MSVEQQLSEQVVIRLTPDMLAELREVSERNERTVAQTVRLAIKRFLDEKRAE